jgi:Beta-lactamase enzyme family
MTQRCGTPTNFTALIGKFMQNLWSVWGLCLCFFWANTGLLAQNRIDLQKLLATNQAELAPVATDIQEFRTRLIYSELDTNRHGKISFKTQSFGLKNDSYFYPASTIKLPVLLFALECLEKYYPALSWTDTLEFEGISDRLPAVKHSAQNAGEAITIENLVKLIGVVSDNDAYNRLFEIVGSDYCNKRLRKMGFRNTQIRHRVGVGGLSPMELTTLPQVNAVLRGGKVILHPKRLFQLPNPPKLKDYSQGKGYYQGDSLVNAPFNFEGKNWFGLSDQHEMLQRLVFPEAFPRKKRFQISETTRLMVLKYLQMLPTEAGPLDVYKQPAGYCKFFVGGGNATTMPQNLTIYNKVGDAYGYLIDNAYIMDKNTGRSFFLSASIRVNTDEVFNDDKYEYESIGLPLFERLSGLLLRAMISE